MHAAQILRNNFFTTKNYFRENSDNRNKPLGNGFHVWCHLRLKSNAFLYRNSADKTTLIQYG